jgi:hypothetical protein
VLEFGDGGLGVSQVAGGEVDHKCGACLIKLWSWMGWGQAVRCRAERDSQHRFHAGLAGRSQCGGGVQEAFHRRPWGMDDKGKRVGHRLVTDGVPRCTDLQERTG